MQSYLYKINRKFAKFENLPIYFTATPIKSTEKAIYLYGHGSLEAATRYGNCFVCGRELTHPASIKLGIGPICRGEDLREEMLNQMSQKEINEILGRILIDKKIDQWIPKSIIQSTEPSDIKINIPENHPMMTRKKVDTKIAKKIKFKNGNPGIHILFPFNRQTLAEVKQIPGRKFHPNAKPKCWTAPLSIEAVEKLEKAGFELDPELITFVKESKINIDDLDNNFKIPGLKHELFEFQKKGVAFIEAKNGRALVADEMGLGKTVQALAWAQKHKNKRPIICVVPASLKINWKREAEKWLENPKVQILYGKNADQKITGDFIIINYTILNDWVDKIKEIEPQLLIIDESHYIKNNKAKRTKAVKKIAKYIPHIIALTGTPIVNRPSEIYNTINLIDKTVMPNKWDFLHRYCDAKHNGFGWDFNGATNTKELHDILTKTIMIRRQKKEVLHDLPDKIRSFVPIELTNRNKYEEAENDFINFIKEKTERDLQIELREKLGQELFENVEFKDHRLERLKQEKAEKAAAGGALVQIESLKQLAVEGKLDQAIDWIENYLESGQKLVVMAVHKFVINRLMKHFKKISVKIDGSVSAANRDLAVQKFQNNKSVKLMIGNIKAAGVGLTLTAADTMVFLELPWTPGDLQQAEDRIHRIGQKNAVNIYYLLAENTIEEKIAYLIDQKRKVLDSVLDGKQVDAGSLISELMKKYQK